VPMIEKPDDLWRSFLGAWAEALAAVPADDLRGAWCSEKSRTYFYRYKLLPQVAVRLRPPLMQQDEWMNFDHLLYTSIPDDIRLPRIIVESENDPFVAQQEVAKLCCLAAPLRVLLTVAEWETTWPHGGLKGKYHKRWDSIREAYTRAWPDAGVVAVLVGELGRDNVLRYYGFELQSSGGHALEERIVFSRDMSVSENPLT
jgi:hypothetical protein